MSDFHESETLHGPDTDQVMILKCQNNSPFIREKQLHRSKNRNELLYLENTKVYFTI